MSTLCSLPSAMPPRPMKSLDSAAATLPPAAVISSFSPCPLSFSALTRPVVNDIFIVDRTGYSSYLQCTFHSWISALTWRQEDWHRLAVQIGKQRLLLCTLVRNRQVEAVLLLGCT